MPAMFQREERAQRALLSVPPTWRREAHALGHEPLFKPAELPVCDVEEVPRSAGGIQHDVVRNSCCKCCTSATVFRLDPLRHGRRWGPDDLHNVRLVRVVGA